MCVCVSSQFVVLLDIFTEQRVAGGREVDGAEAAVPPSNLHTHTHRFSGTRVEGGWSRWCARLRPVPAPASSAGSALERE